MKKFFKYAMMLAAVAAMPVFTACDDDDDDKNTDEAKETALAAANKQFVNETVIPTYKGLADATEELIGAIEAFDASRSQADLNKVAELWKSSRQYWEWSEAFLFGAASGYGIDPHIDTWPFDVSQFDNFMSKYNPSGNDADAEAIDHIIATSQNLTGFHAVEYLIYRNGSVRNAADLTDDEVYFCISAAGDLYLSACRLEVAWAGTAKQSRLDLLEEEELEPEDDFGEELINAGNAGSRWKTVTLASIQIIEGCRSIIDEVGNSKIGSAANGEDVSYIESPHAYNSIQDFYDNIMSCKHALYGGLTQSGTTPAQGSLMAYAVANHPTEAAAAEAALEAALAAIKPGMKAPFVLYYSDPSAKAAMAALDALDAALGDLQDALED